MLGVSRLGVPISSRGDSQPLSASHSASLRTRKKLVAMPIRMLANMVSEKPWIGPIPAANSASIASPVTKLASRMVASEPAKPRRTAWLKLLLRANCSRTRSKQMMLASAAMPMPSTKATTADSDKVAWAALNTINSSHRYTTVDSAAIKPRPRYRPISSAKMQAMPISPALTVSVRAVRPSTLPTV